MRRSAVRVLVAALLVWLGFTALVLAWIFLRVVTAESEHMAGDWTLGVIVLAPFWVLSLLALASLVALVRGHRLAPRLGLAWGIGGVFAASVALLPIVNVLAMAFKEGGHLLLRLGDPFLVAGNAADGTYYKYWIDVLPAIWLVSALAGLVASTRLLAASSTRADGAVGSDRATTPPAG
jgi:hypothetical protein